MNLAFGGSITEELPGHLQPSLGSLGASWKHAGDAVFGIFWGRLGLPKRSVTSLEAILAPVWWPLELFWGPLGAVLARIGAVLGPSWAVLGPSWISWAVLSPSGGPLGPSWSHLEASEAHRERNGEKAHTVQTHSVLNDFGSRGLS